MPFKIAKARLATCVWQLSGIVLLATPSLASATFSIVACDRSGHCGAAVATNNLAVGASVPYAQAKLGALVSQFETNPAYGPQGLVLLASGETPDAAIKILLDGDNNFDNSTIAARQVGMVDASGRSASYTGAEAQSSTWAGEEHGDGFSIQGNGLAGEQVASSMKRAFLSSTGTLAERLMASLEAGEKAGGQTTGKLSAALLVKTTEGAWQDIDLRVDGAPEPVKDLRRLLEQHYALQAIIRAEHQAKKGAIDDAHTSISEALHRCYGWDRIWRRAARLAMTMGDKDRALDYLSVFLSINPVWGRMELRDSIYQPLHTNALFRSWNN
ncbi:DUF1028 domain-containing protein [Undibacterium sp. Di26W]|uniref:DUF1028 domain-containing protein n=1 Tax=Undibacterium sp. Di26W TaxID=3413035 RepID=UPI003BF0AAC5